MLSLEEKKKLFANAPLLFQQAFNSWYHIEAKDEHVNSFKYMISYIK